MYLLGGLFIPLLIITTGYLLGDITHCMAQRRDHKCTMVTLLTDGSVSIMIATIINNTTCIYSIVI